MRLKLSTSLQTKILSRFILFYMHLLSIQLKNPTQVLVDAIVNTGPREDSTRIGSQGTVRRQAVDVSPLRRVNQAVALLTIGVRTSEYPKCFYNSRSHLDPADS